MVWAPTYPEMGCTALNNAGTEYEDLTCLYPSLRKFYMNWEVGYDPVPVRDWTQDHPIVPIAACVIYALFIVCGRAYFEGRPALSWRRALALWNFSLSLFSFIGMIRTAPQLLHNLYHMSLRDNICNNPESQFGSGSTGFWVQMFCLSKFPELIDTFFIVIHKKPLIFLHWYHHITVLLYCWHSYATTSPTGLWFVVMNYAVHFVMYGYYYLMAMRLKPRWMNAAFITCAQISQMVVGVAVTLLAFYYYEEDGPKAAEPCWVKKENNVAACVMYGSYLFLFVQFFIGRYFRVSVDKKTKTKKTE
eukprot:CAMPEP_0178719580 /NCGR_PEP_ID=MMETSP0699-20121125/23228_2 /TAXON_ID=265572 /ORGANISM="Extubocellulus spinifer, Strain CCMP396" /LENGTH=303 /DNA_ID=CAMNT_0020369881 /DNA_START=126 /DNA_END=1037 /DNA_ORIENTATION=-